MIFRLSEKLGRKIDAGKRSESTLDQNPYADWSCHLFTADRTQYIMLSNTPSLYSGVMYGKGITDDRRFIERALSTIRDFMEDDGQQFAFLKFIAPAGASVRFAKPLNRAVTGSMNDLIHAAKFHLAGGMAPGDVGFRLNETPVSILNDENPRDAFRSLGI